MQLVLKHKRSWLFSLSLVALGCSGGSDLEDSEAQSSHSLGLMSVIYSHDWSQNGEQLDLDTTAQFVRFSAIDATNVRRLLALPLDPKADLPDLGQCAVSARDGGEDLLEEDQAKANVELLEAGDLAVHTASTTVTLTPRHFPGLLPFVSGVVYGEAQASNVAREQAVQAEANGGLSVGAFTAQGESPRLPHLTLVAGGAPDHADLQLGSPLSLNWEVTSQGARIDAPLTYIELHWAKGDGERLLHCRVEDSGSFEIDGAYMRELTEGGAQGQLVLDLVRLRQSNFEAPGLDQAELRISARDRTTISLR